MKPLQLGLDWFPESAGGLQRYFFELYNVAPLLFAGGGMVLGSDQVAAATGGRVVSFAARQDGLLRRMTGARRTFRHLVRANGPDLVASHFALFAAPVLDLLDRPLVVHFHGPWALESASEQGGRWRVQAQRQIERAVYRRGTLFIVLSQAFARLLQHEYEVPAECVRVVPGGVNLRRFDLAETRHEARERLGWPADRPILFTVRRLVRRMGLDVLVEAMREVSARHRDALLLIAGRGPLAAELAGRISAAGLDSHVRLVGFLADDELPLAYRAADLCVVPTQALEGFGLIALESLAAGTPALVTPVGGLPEVVAPLSPALVFAGVDAGVMAERIRAAIEKRTVPTSEQCRSYAEEFAWPSIAERLEAIYREARS